MQPGPEIRAGLEPAELFVSLQKGLLNDVFRVRRIAGHPVRQPEDSAAMAFHKRAESLAISVARQRDGGGVRMRHPIA